MQPSSASGLGQIVGQFKSWFAGLLGKSSAPQDSVSSRDVNRGKRIAGANAQLGSGAQSIEQETVMISPFARKKLLAHQTVLICTADHGLFVDLPNGPDERIVTAETKKEMIDCVHELKFEFIFLDFDPLQDGTMAFRLAKKIRGTGYTGKIYLLGKSSKNNGDVLARSYEADGLVEKDYRQIMRIVG